MVSSIIVGDNFQKIDYPPIFFFLFPHNPSFARFFIFIFHYWSGGMKTNVRTSPGLWPVWFSMVLGFWFSRLASIHAYIQYRAVSLISFIALTVIVVPIQIQCNKTRAITNR